MVEDVVIYKTFPFFITSEALEKSMVTKSMVTRCIAEKYSNSWHLVIIYCHQP